MPMTLKLGMQHQVSSNDNLTLSYFTARSKFGPLCVCMEKIGKTMDSLCHSR